MRWRETLGVLRRHRGVTRIELEGLDDHGVMSLMGPRSSGAAALDDAAVSLGARRAP